MSSLRGRVSVVRLVEVDFGVVAGDPGGGVGDGAEAGVLAVGLLHYAGWWCEFKLQRERHLHFGDQFFEIHTIAEWIEIGVFDYVSRVIPASGYGLPKKLH